MRGKKAAALALSDLRPMALAPAQRTPRSGNVLARGVITCYLSLIVLIPLAAVFGRSLESGLGGFWDAITSPQAVAALQFSLLCSLVVVAINAVVGTLIAWVLVRDDFPGKGLVDAVIDLPFALPTIVAGLTLIALYGPQSPIGVDVAYTRAGVILALLFVTLPFVVRAVQPVLLALDREAEEAAAALGAGRYATFRRIVLPALLPAILSGVGLGFARAIGEFGSVVLISGNIPFQTEVAAVHIFGQIEGDDVTGAAAISIVLLALSLVVLLLINVAVRWGTRHDH